MDVLQAAYCGIFIAEVLPSAEIGWYVSTVFRDGKYCLTVQGMNPLQVHV